jgi:ABC-2 type transport system ATP-binding protein
MQLFKEFGREGRTLLVSSHILHEVESLTSEVALIHHGRIVAEGQIEEIRALIENQPLTLRMESPDQRRIARDLAGVEGVYSLSFEDEGLVVRTRAPEAVYETLQAGVMEKRYSVDQLQALDDNLEAVFQYLVQE